MMLVIGVFDLAQWLVSCAVGVRVCNVLAVQSLFLFCWVFICEAGMHKRECNGRLVVENIATIRDFGVVGL